MRESKKLFLEKFRKPARKLTKNPKKANSKDAEKSPLILKMREAILIVPMVLQVRISASNNFLAFFVAFSRIFSCNISNYLSLRKISLACLVFVATRIRTIRMIRTP